MAIPYRCPLCGHALKLKNRSYICVNNHCFDVAKEGYVNLLPVQHKKSKNPGDNQEMIQARTRFLTKGYYNAFCNELKNTLTAKSGNVNNLLDLGCGNGWYSERLKQQLGIIEIHGIDISKHAIKTAAKTNKQNQYAVASAFSLPYNDAQFSAILCVFSPVQLSEVLRVLKPGGVFIFSGPGPSHLKELASIIYHEVHEHKGNPVELNQSESFETIEKKSYNARQTVEGPDILDLLAMTPYYWSTGEEKKKQIAELEKLPVQLDFEITIAVKS